MRKISNKKTERWKWSAIEGAPIGETGGSMPDQVLNAEAYTIKCATRRKCKFEGNLEKL